MKEETEQNTHTHKHKYTHANTSTHTHHGWRGVHWRAGSADDGYPEGVQWPCQWCVHASVVVCVRCTLHAIVARTTKCVLVGARVPCKRTFFASCAHLAHWCLYIARVHSCVSLCVCVCVCVHMNTCTHENPHVNVTERMNGHACVHSLCVRARVCLRSCRCVLVFVLLQFFFLENLFTVHQARHVYLCPLRAVEEFHPVQVQSSHVSGC